jgi:sugar phosphate isomerase/epimerase
VPEGENDPRHRLMTEALTSLARHGDHVGTTLALDTGLDPGPALAAYLDRFDTGSLAVNFDPANLIVNGFNVFEAVAALRQRIVQCHARDARSASASRVASEVPLGHGSLDWLAFLSALEETGYRGYLIVAREMGNDPLGDVTAGVTFLRRLIGPG